MSRFSETLLDHARHPRNFGRDTDANAIGRADFDSQPPTVIIYLRIEEGTIKRASFEAAGCGVTIGVCSALTELLPNLSLAQGQKLTPEKLSAHVDGIPGDKIHCAHIAVAALRQAVSLATD